MPLSADISTALHLLEHIHKRVDDCGDKKFQTHISHDLEALISLLEDPTFRSVITIQDSLTDLNAQLGQHPSILPGDFDITLGGQLELSVPSTPLEPLTANVYRELYQDSSELEDQRVPVAPLTHSSSEDTSAQVTSPSMVSDLIGIPAITTPTYAKEFQKVIESAAKGRQVCTVQLFKPEGTSLGFSVVGLRSTDRGELGIFLQEIQLTGIAGCDGRLVEGDQILAIDGQPLDSNISHEQAISILQKARGLVELVVARSSPDAGSIPQTDEVSAASNSTVAAGETVSVVGAGAPGNKIISEKDNTATLSIGTQEVNNPVSNATTHGGLLVERSPSAISDTSKTSFDMVLNTEWAQVEVINLINDGSGLGFGIIGGRSTGVVVKTILPGGVADRDNRLQSGDHILQIGDVNLRGMGSEQVAAVLRQSGTHVRLVVARPVEPTSPDYQALGSHAPIVPTKILGDPDELDRHLENNVPENFNNKNLRNSANSENGSMYAQEQDIEIHSRPSLIMDIVRNPVPIGATPAIPVVPITAQIPELPVLSMEAIDVTALPEMERFSVELRKDIYGLGITIAGYVCEKEELSGIFVKSVSKGSAADLSNMIRINDRVVEVDGHSLHGYSNHEAVEVLRSTGQNVLLCLERYLRGPKYEQLQQAIAASELRVPQPSSPSIASLPSFPISADGDTTTDIEPEGESHTTVDSGNLHEAIFTETEDDPKMAVNIQALLADTSCELTPQIRTAIRDKWQKILGKSTEIVVAQLNKFAEGSGLGISLEGTVDVENGQEVRPHHYIRSILPEGPVGQNGILRSGDELLEVNGYRLLGINHMEVVSVLKELPINVRMVCGRNIASPDPLCPIDTAQHQAAFQTRSILGGSLQNLLPTTDRLVKAKSDGSLASTTTATVTDASLNKMKSRSLEPLTGLAMWSLEPQIIQLVKGERGLGFSILDYQDPMNPNETVIVIRSLVPGGVAQVDGQLIPGDRLLFVNDIALENATLDQAVQALKGAPKGTVRIGVAKPLPIPDSIAQDLGSSKAEVAARFINNRISGCNVISHCCMIQDKDEAFYRQFHIIVCGLDSIIARRWINGMLLSLLVYKDAELDQTSVIPMVDGGTEGFKGNARVLLPGLTACIECTLDLYPPQTTYPLCTIANTPRLPEHCIEYVKVIQWPKENPFECPIDGDDPQHVNWIYEKSIERAGQFGIRGLTYRLVQGVVKNIIPAVASTNAAIAATCATEVFKLATSCTVSLNNYMVLNNLDGIYSYTYEAERKPDCLACSQVPREIHVRDETIKLKELIDMLCERIDLQMKNPGLTAHINGKMKTLYMQTVASIEEKTRENLSKTLAELDLADGTEINVADVTTPNTIVLKIRFQPRDVDMT